MLSSDSAISPLLRNGDSSSPYAEHMVKRHYGVRTERYKLIHFYNDIDEWELYDLQADPTEMRNIYGQPGTEDIVKELKTELTALQEQYNDPVRFSPERDKE